MNGCKDDVVIYTQWNTTKPEKNEISPFATPDMNLEGIMLTEISQTERQKPYDFTHI